MAKLNVPADHRVKTHEGAPAVANLNAGTDFETFCHGMFVMGVGILRRRSVYC